MNEELFIVVDLSYEELAKEGGIEGLSFSISINSYYTLDYCISFAGHRNILQDRTKVEMVKTLNIFTVLLLFSK